MGLRSVSPSGPFSQQLMFGCAANAFVLQAWGKFVNGTIRGIVQFDGAFAAGESLTLNILRADTDASILTGALVLDATDLVGARQTIPFSQALYDAVQTTIMLRFTAVYVAGGGPANPTVAIFIECGGQFAPSVGGVPEAPFLT